MCTDSPKCTCLQQVFTSNSCYAGHNGCLQCMASVRRSKPECPLCRNSIPPDVQLVENKELRDLIALASALYTVPTGHDEWEAVTSCSTGNTSQKADADSKSDITLVPTAPPAHMTLSRVMEGEADLLSLEPPSWLPDSHAQECGQCQKPFRCVNMARTKTCTSQTITQPDLILCSLCITAGAVTLLCDSCCIASHWLSCLVLSTPRRHKLCSVMAKSAHVTASPQRTIRQSVQLYWLECCCWR